MRNIKIIRTLGIVCIALLCSAAIVRAFDRSVIDNESIIIENPILADGEFVYGPNVGQFSTEEYLEKNAPSLIKYASVIDGKAGLYSINPRVIITVLEIKFGFITKTSEVTFDDSSFKDSLEEICQKLFSAYYSHGFQNELLSTDERKILIISTKNGVDLNISENYNAGSYAVIYALTDDMTDVEVERLTDSNRGGFVQIYSTLFEERSSLDSSNNVIPTISTLESTAADYDWLQFPYPQEESWYFNGVHSNGGGTEMSSIDFSPSLPFPSWGSDTSNMKVSAAANGRVEQTSSCRVRIKHFNYNGEDTPWSTQYYHLEGVDVSVNEIVRRNDALAELASTLNKATCEGGEASGVHVHFALLYNGAFVGIDSKLLSHWTIHSGDYAYDNNCNRMYLYKDSDGDGMKDEDETKICYGSAINNLYCRPPLPDEVTWHVDSSCSHKNNSTANGNVVVHYDTINDINNLLTIENSSTLNMDFINYKLDVENGSGILIKNNSKIN